MSPCPKRMLILRVATSREGRQSKARNARCFFGSVNSGGIFSPRACERAAVKQSGKHSAAVFEDANQQRHRRSDSEAR